MLKLPDFPSSPLGLEEPMRRAVQTLDDHFGIERVSTLRRIAALTGGESIRVRGVSDEGKERSIYHFVEIRALHGETDPNQFAYNHSSARGYGDLIDTVEHYATAFSLGLYALKRLLPKEKAVRAFLREYDPRGFGGDNHANMADANQRTQHIRIYQGSMEEVERDLGKPLQRVDLKGPLTYLKAGDDVWLRIQAHNVGADAIIHCQPGSAMGTPVRYVK